MRHEWRLTCMSSTIAFSFDTGLHGEGLASGCFQTPKGNSNESSVRGKGRAIGWLLKWILGCTDSAPHGENQAPCAPVFCMRLHTQSVTLFVPRNLLTDLGSLELPYRAKTCGCVLAFPVCLGSLPQPQVREKKPEKRSPGSDFPPGL